MPNIRDDSRDEDGDDPRDGLRGSAAGDEASDAWSDQDDASTAFCPDCGAEVWDAADVCPKCFTWLNGDTSRHPPRRARRRERARNTVVWILIAAMVAGGAIFWLA